MKVAKLSTVALVFKGIKSRAESRWQELWKSGNPVVMVGTATCGRAAGALEVLQAILGLQVRKCLCLGCGLGDKHYS